MLNVSNATFVVSLVSVSKVKKSPSSKSKSGIVAPAKFVVVLLPALSIIINPSPYSSLILSFAVVLKISSNNISPVSFGLLYNNLSVTDSEELLSDIKVPDSSNMNVAYSELDVTVLTSLSNLIGEES